MTSIVVTGASSGIGWGVVAALTAKGMHVFGSVRRQADADRLKAEVEGLKGEIAAAGEAQAAAAQAQAPGAPAAHQRAHHQERDGDLHADLEGGAGVRLKK